MSIGQTLSANDSGVLLHPSFFLAFPASDAETLMSEEEQALEPTKRWGLQYIPLKGTKRLAMKYSLRNFKEYAMYGVFHQTTWLVLEVQIPQESVNRFFTEQKLVRCDGGWYENHRWHYRFTGSSSELMRFPLVWSYFGVPPMGTEGWSDICLGSPGSDTLCNSCGQSDLKTWKVEPFHSAPSLCHSCLFRKFAPPEALE